VNGAQTPAFVHAHELIASQDDLVDLLPHASVLEDVTVAPLHEPLPFTVTHAQPFEQSP
jgi:hypothetical protein